MAPITRIIPRFPSTHPRPSKGRSPACRTLTLEPLDYETVVLPVLGRHGIAGEGFSADLKSLLAVPENLRLLVDSAASGAVPAELAALTSAYQLQALYLEDVVRRDPELGDSALAALQALASRMMQERALRLPRSSLQIDESRLRRLISQGVLAEPVGTSGQALAFGHQTLLDALAVRSALAEGQTLAGFVLGFPPFPFLRPAVRSFAMHLRATDPPAFRRQVRAAVGEPRIAYHLKRVLIESLAEMVPTDDDWPLIRYLWQEQTDLFRRLLWQARHDEWFRVLRQHWWPNLTDTDAEDPLRADFVLRVERWMTRSPAEVVALWRETIQSRWGARLNLPGQVAFQLQRLSCWDAPGVEALLEELVAYLRDTQGDGQTDDEDYDPLLVPLSRFVDATGRGVDLLWRQACRKVDFSDPYRLWKGLHCAPHHFCREDFLSALLSHSDPFLDLVLSFVEIGSRHHAARLGVDGVYTGLLWDTPWMDTHSQCEARFREDIDTLMSAVSDAIRQRSRDTGDWWRETEPRLRCHPDAGLRYLLLLAYAEDPEENIDGIAYQLVDRVLYEEGELRFELAEMANRVYHLLPAAIRDRHQAMLFELYSPTDPNAAKQWHIAQLYEDLLRIPAPFRCEQAQAYLDRWHRRFGSIRPAPHVSFWGGWVRPPVDSARLVDLSDGSLFRLVAWYADREIGRAEIQNEGLVGGRNQLITQIADAAALAPHRFLDLAPGLLAAGCHPEFFAAILRGAATHLRYRFGNLQTASGRWEPREPLPDGPGLAERILSLLERYAHVWTNERTLGEILTGCVAAVEGPDPIERSVWMLLRLAKAVRPERERVRFDPGVRPKVETRDLLQDAHNEPRGIAAVLAMELANRLAERGEPWPELLAPLILRLASDPVASVRAAILDRLPYLHSKDSELGWDLLSRCLRKSHPALWTLAGQVLYYQLRHQFGRVAPYLDRMLAEGTGQSDDTWSSLSVLAVLEGHIRADDLFARLDTLDRSELWKGAASVFVANIGESAVAQRCRSGLWRILDHSRASEILVSLDRALERHIRYQPADTRLVERFIDCIGPGFKRWDLLGLTKWLAAAARCAPLATLPLLEQLASKLELSHPMGTFLDGTRLIGALLEVLREADDSDDRELIARAVRLQDRFLSLGLTGMEEMLNEASCR